jgi:hypothetical protein
MKLIVWYYLLKIKVLYTEQKTKKVKIWLDGYLVPRPTLNSVGESHFSIDFCEE